MHHVVVAAAAVVVGRTGCGDCVGVRGRAVGAAAVAASRIPGCAGGHRRRHCRHCCPHCPHRLHQPHGRHPPRPQHLPTPGLKPRDYCWCCCWCYCHAFHPCYCRRSCCRCYCLQRMSQNCFVFDLSRHPVGLHRPHHQPRRSQPAPCPFLSLSLCLPRVSRKDPAADAAPAAALADARGAAAAAAAPPAAGAAAGSVCRPGAVGRAAGPQTPPAHGCASPPPRRQCRRRRRRLGSCCYLPLRLC